LAHNWLILFNKEKKKLKNKAVLKMKEKVNGMPLHLTRRFGVMAALSRRKFCGNLEICRPLEV
jgi:hypothetical protein